MIAVLASAAEEHRMLVIMMYFLGCFDLFFGEKVRGWREGRCKEVLQLHTLFLHSMGIAMDKTGQDRIEYGSPR